MVGLDAFAHAETLLQGFDIMWWCDHEGHDITNGGITPYVQRYGVVRLDSPVLEIYTIIYLDVI